jgi:hypothetical protein
MESYKLEQVSSKTMTSKKTGKDFESVGIKIDGEWYNGFGKPGVTDKWQEGMEITGIELYQNGDYKNWRFVRLEDRIDALEKRIAELEKNGIGF